MRNILRSGLAAASLFAAVPAFAATMQPFTQTAFEAAQKSGAPVIVDVYAPWCPVCAAQEPVLQTLETDPAYKNLTMLRVDFDRQKSSLRDLNVEQQSTIIGYRNGHEVSRVAGGTSREAIESVFAAAAKN